MTTPTEQNMQDSNVAESNAPQSNVTDTAVPATSVKATNVKEVLAYLAVQFPACFSLTGAAKPLKIGIFQDLAQRLQQDDTISKTQLRQALRVYTSSWRYLESTKEGIARVDLDGVDGDLIDAAQAEHANKVLDDSKAKAAEKRKAKQAELKAKTATAAATEKPAYKKMPNKKPATSSNSTKVKQKPVNPVAAPVVAAPALQQASEEQVVVGGKVLLKLGQSPMLATVLEINKDDVTVQLGSGMVIKTRQGSLYLA